MILILSHNHFDEPTNKVIDWLYFYNANFRRLNGADFTPEKNFKIDLVNNKLILDDNAISPIEINVIFYRRWVKPNVVKIDFENYLKRNYTKDEVLLIECYHTYLRSELNAYTNSIFSFFKSKAWIPNVHLARRGGINKIDVLLKAKELGLSIPDTIIASSKEEVLNFIKEYKRIITKPISEVAPILYKTTAISMYTKEVKITDINKFPNRFFPSLFQKKIDKEFEVRTFIYKRYIYSIAIFSQNDAQTNIDFRNYNFELPNRNVPFLLPKEIETKLFKLMEEIGLNTGSIDIMLDKNGDYIFLEVNPVGQSGMVSVGGNYNLEKIIAEDLINCDKNYE
ncbi:grasp-with-spasm system ATP-grasp peptide maturase [Flavobacterium humidisoli]|uniref:Grasp-with-spasm system ATP-grasp peptide maturase n=1 Tax=Flavobacterium humidisoli TaxID=2937442 RepID=A0ABY4LYU5_9FLAO|nr:grasp-with-spasm system ATP-grasp peptide maturase [Flavobacterium humidisoli]UPZ17992.1 grasp-with-spasm system ATP-grasp peptide maturase [Flavobacterium humidisoli]